MAQGAIKTKKTAAKPSGRRDNVLGPKKGARSIKPKKQALVQNAKMIKVGLPHPPAPPHTFLLHLSSETFSALDPPEGY